MTTEIQKQGGWGSGDTSYDEFVKRERVPMIRSLWVEDVLNLPLEPWLRKGGRGAYINLDGSGINTSYIAIDCYVVEIAAGGCLNPEHYLYDEILYVLKGNGAATVWTPESKKQTFEWQEGSLFTIPLNAPHRLFNGEGNQPAVLLGFSFAPTMINLLHNEDFIFKNAFSFTDRYRGEDDYFQGQPKILDKNWLDTNFIRDVRAFAADKQALASRVASQMSPRWFISKWAVTPCPCTSWDFPSGLTPKRTATSQARIF